MKSPEKSIAKDVEEGEITSDEEAPAERRSKPDAQPSERERERPAVCDSDTESAPSVNGIKEVS